MPNLGKIITQAVKGIGKTLKQATANTEEPLKRASVLRANSKSLKTSAEEQQNLGDAYALRHKELVSDIVILENDKKAYPHMRDNITSEIELRRTEAYEVIDKAEEAQMLQKGFEKNSAASLKKARQEGIVPAHKVMAKQRVAEYGVVGAVAGGVGTVAGTAMTNKANERQKQSLVKNMQVKSPVMGADPEMMMQEAKKKLQFIQKR